MNENLASPQAKWSKTVGGVTVNVNKMAGKKWMYTYDMQTSDRTKISSPRSTTFVTTYYWEGWDPATHTGGWSYTMTTSITYKSPCETKTKYTLGGASALSPTADAWTGVKQDLVITPLKTFTGTAAGDKNGVCIIKYLSTGSPATGFSTNKVSNNAFTDGRASRPSSTITTTGTSTVSLTATRSAYINTPYNAGTYTYNVDVVVRDKDYASYQSVGSTITFNWVLSDPCATVTITRPVFTRVDYTAEKASSVKDFDVDFTKNYSQNSTPACPHRITLTAGSLSSYLTLDSTN